MEKLTFITGNQAKAKYLSDYFDWPIKHRSLDLPEIQSMDLEQIVADKAIQAFKIIKSPVLVEDVSLVFNALNGLPGPLIRWFLKALGNEGLCKLLDGKERSALARVAFCYFDGQKPIIFDGKRKGKISDKPRGNMNFGWDPIFIPEGFDRTWAEMTQDEKHKTSMRKIALEKLKGYLNGI